MGLEGREMDGIGSTMQKKAAELERLAEVLVTGEQLRLRLHEGKLIKDRRHHLLCDEHREFKDLKLFYRFRKDDGTFPLDSEAKVFMRGQRIYEKLMNTENNLLQTREEENGSFERALVATEFIDWLLQEGEMATREEAEQLGRRLLEHGIIQHVTNKHHFVNGPLLYQFRMNFRLPSASASRTRMEATPASSQIVGDAVGWGFVVRGSAPCHIQAVDPGGPAAAAGMKVCHFVVSVNGRNVLAQDYRAVSSLILTGPRTIVMEVMEEA
ncbi:DEP domain-containing mTOR-interacting protein [Liparis tanakae]|uniref:DEP domain-containing mTOR-interacting protein n=1 Tax=Liparis tanakae TaxID=230148 RepID=A0A4Z2GG94_9TELE|nr:DEP domain-containing mTOR-interacting protein [Liparis tanakae]